MTVNIYSKKYVRELFHAVDNDDSNVSKINTYSEQSQGGYCLA